MATLVSILILVGATFLLAVFLLAFTYPGVLVKVGRFLFVKPVKAIFKNGHPKAAPLAVNAQAAKTDVTQVK